MIGDLSTAALFQTEHHQVARITVITDRGTTVYAILSDGTLERITHLILTGNTQEPFGDVVLENDPSRFDESFILTGGLTVDSYSMTGSRIEIGTAIAAELTLNLKNSDGRFDPMVFAGKEIFVEIGTKDWSTDDPITYIPLGYFQVDKEPKNGQEIKISALDRMVSKFDVEIDWTQFTFPMTVQALVSTVCTVCGVTCATTISSLPNASYSIAATPEGTCTMYRDLIQWAAFVTGTCAQFGPDGELYFKWYTDTGFSLTSANRFSHDLDNEDITLTGIHYTDNNGIEYLVGTAGYTLEASQVGILQNDIETALGNILTALDGFTYRPLEQAVIVTAPFLQPLDMVEFTDARGDTHDCIISHITYTINSSTTVAGRGDTEVATNYAPQTGLTRQQEEAVAGASREATHYLAVDDTGIMVADMSDGQRYTPSTAPTGTKNVKIDSDSVDVRDGQTVLASFGEQTRIGKENSTHLDLSASGMDIVGRNSDNSVHIGAQSTENVHREEDWEFPGYTTDDSGIVPSITVIDLPEELVLTDDITVTITGGSTHTIPAGTAYSYSGISYGITYDGSRTLEVENLTASAINAVIGYLVAEPSNYTMRLSTNSASRIKVRSSSGGTTVAEGGIYANDAGNFGLFDTMRARWVVAVDEDGNTKIPGLRPVLLSADTVTAPATQSQAAYLNIDLSEWAVIGIYAQVNNVWMFLIFIYVGSGLKQYISDTYVYNGNAYYNRGGFWADWTRNRIYVTCVNGAADAYQYVKFNRVFGLLRK